MSLFTAKKQVIHIFSVEMTVLHPNNNVKRRKKNSHKYVYMSFRKKNWYRV